MPKLPQQFSCLTRDIAFSRFSSGAAEPGGSGMGACAPPPLLIVKKVPFLQ
jgi:hypothetical protein